MGDLTYTQIEAEVKVELVQRDDIDAVIQNSIYHAYQDIATIFHHYELEVSDTFPLVVGTREYDLTTIVDYLRVILSVRNTTKGKKLDKVDWRIFDSMSSFSSGPPSRYARFGSKIEFDTLPDATDTIKIKFARKVTAISAGQTTLLLPEWDEGIVLGAIYRALERVKEYDQAEVAKNRYLEFVQSRTRPRDLEDEDLDEPLGVRIGG